MQKLHGAPWGFIGEANIANPAVLDFLLQSGQGFFKVGDMLLCMGFGIAITQFAKEVGRALWPVQLV